MTAVQTEATGLDATPDTPDAPDSPAAPATHRWWALAAIGLAQLMVVLDATIVNIALPSAQRALGFDDAGRQWIVTAYSLAFGSLLLFGGRLADLFGRRATFIVGTVGFALASAVGGAATGFPMLVAARAVQGGFGALLAPAALSLLTTTFTDTRERARAFGIYGAIAGSGAAIGLILGGLLTEYLDWRWTLYVNDIIAVLALGGALAFLRRAEPARRPRLDVPGVLLVSGGLFGVVYGFASADTHGWRDRLTWLCLAIGGILLLTFFRWQARARNPLLPPRVLTDRDRGAALATILISSAGMFGVFLFLTYYLQATLGYSPVRNGLAFLPMVGALMVLAQLSTNLLVPRLGPKVVVPAGMVLAALGMVWLTRLGAHSTYPAHVLPPLLFMGAGLGLAMPAAISQATLGVRAADQGVASATVNATQQVGGSISVALLNTLASSAAAHFARRHPADRLGAALHSYATVYWWSAGFFAAAAVITVLLFTRRPAPVPTADGALIRGRVLDAAGAPVPRAAITLLDLAGRQVARTDAAEDGTYAVRTPRLLGLVLIGSAPGHRPHVATLAVGSAPIAHDLVMLARAGRLAGTVRGADGEPVAGARVAAVDPGGAVAASTRSGTDGEYRLDGLSPGRYTVTVGAPGFRTGTVPVSVTGAGTRCDVALDPAPRVAGTVRGPDGRPLAGARVTLLDPAGNVVAAHATGADGRYAFTDLAGDEYTVVATGYPPVAAPLVVTGGRDGFDLVLGYGEG